MLSIQSIKIANQQKIRSFTLTKLTEEKEPMRMSFFAFKRLKMEDLKKLLDEHKEIFVISIGLPPLKITFAKLQ